MSTPQKLIETYPKFNYPSVHWCGVAGVSDTVAILSSERSEVDGLTAVFVYKDRVALMAVRYALNYNDWFTVDGRPYDNIDELEDVLNEFTKAKAASCWDEG